MEQQEEQYVLHRAGDDWRFAMNKGSTLQTRFWLAWGSLLQGLGFFFGNASWLSSPVYRSLNELIPLHYWGWAYLLVGLLMFWRVLSPKSRLAWAYISNILACTVYSIGMMTRLLGPLMVNKHAGLFDGLPSLLSVHTLLVGIAVFVLIRTDSTYRDVRTA